MSDERDKRRVQDAMNACFSDLKPDPWLARRLLSRAERKEKVKKKVSMGLVLALVLMMATAAIALAATQLGWLDYLSEDYGVPVPAAMQDELKASQGIACQVGPLTFTYEQLLTDGHIALSAAHVRTTDGTEALIAADSDLQEPMDQRACKDICEKYDLAPGTTWVQAAEQLGLPLYGVRALVESEQATGEAMEAAMWQEDGSIVYLNQIALEAETQALALYMAVHTYENGEVQVNAYRESETVAVPVLPVLEARSYQGEGVRAQAKRYATGAYFTLTFDEPVDAYALTLCDAQGEELPWGVNLSGTRQISDTQAEMMASVDALPDGLMLDGKALTAE